MKTAGQLHDEIKTLIEWSRFLVRWEFDRDKLRSTAIALGERLKQLDEAEGVQPDE